MAEITATLVKELRDKTGAGMMDSKKALVESSGDMEAAMDWLRKKGLSKAAKKAGRAATEGLVGVALSSEGASAAGAVVEVNSETDFVARNDVFQSFVREAADAALETMGDVEKILGAQTPSGEPVEAKLTNLISTIGENMAVRRAGAIAVDPGVVAAYVHNQVADGVGKIGVLVALESDGDTAKLSELGRKIAMHVAAARPLAVSADEVDPDVIAYERSVFAEQARASGKPENIIEKMVDGRLRKFYEESVLLEQTFVVDGETPMKKVLEAAAKDVGAPVKLAGFIRMELGEGVEKAEDDADGA